MTRAGVRRIHIGVITDERRILNGWNIAISNHFRGFEYLRVSHRSLADPSVDVTTQAQLWMREQIEPPVINAVRKARSISDTERIETRAGEVGLAEGFIDVGVPSTFRYGRGAVKGLPVITHVREQARRPDIIDAMNGRERCGVILCVAHIHCGGDADLAKIVDAGGLFRPRFCLAQGR